MDTLILPATVKAMERRRAEIMLELEKNTADLKTMNEMQDGDQMDDTSFRQALEMRERLDAQLREISHLQTLGIVLNTDHVPDINSIGVGHAVRVKVTFADGFEDEFTLTLVSTLDARYLPKSVNGDDNHIVVSISSPLGKAILGHAKGKTIKYATPEGEAKAKIIDVNLSPLLNHLEP